MSKIEVNTIEPQCGTTLTVGASGDTITFPTGTTIVNNGTQTGFGRTGTVDWITTPKTATFTAVSGEGYFVNTTAGAITVNLPAGVAGAIVSVADYAATWQTYNVTVVPNGTDKIGSQNLNVTLNTEGQSVTLVYVDSTQGWINTMDSTSNVRAGIFICASVSGACNTLVTAPCCANVKIATFTGPGSFTVNTISTTPAENTIGYMVVAGGGGGFLGAGGGGGFREGRNVPIDNFTASPLVANAPTNAVIVTATSYPITIGGGGASNTSNGGNSVFSTITSTGGGRGADYQGTGNSGGSGGGGGRDVSSTSVGNSPPVSPPQGQNGGGGVSSGPNSDYIGAGGGGGAGANGNPGTGNSLAVNEQGGAGGNGVANSITGSSVIRAGGGGGYTQGPGNPGGAGGSGGGGVGGQGTPNPLSNGTPGTINTGGGAGGGAPAGGVGGSGIVVIRYKFK